MNSLFIYTRATVCLSSNCYLCAILQNFEWNGLVNYDLRMRMSQWERDRWNQLSLTRWFSEIRRKTTHWTKPSTYWYKSQSHRQKQRRNWQIPSIGCFWLWESMYWLLRVDMPHTSWRYDRRGKHDCSCIYSCESRTLTYVVYRFNPSTNRGFRYITPVSLY